ncbi:MAG: YgiT-type zinc finger protein [Nitrospirae bacterium]|nr:YgiT-type zinc finger protein [Nitrospirota bacterium]
MNRVCNFCGNKNVSSKLVQYVYKHDDRFLVVNNVPCEECEYCGERYFRAHDLKRIEKDFFAIYEHGKKAARKISVPVEEFVELS